MTEVMIDPNVRVAGGLTFSGFEDVRGPMPVTGQQVLVREPEANLVAVGIIDHIDTAAQVIYIAVDWAQMAPDEIPTPDEFVSRIGHLGGNLARSPITRQIVGEATPQTA